MVAGAKSLVNTSTSRAQLPGRLEAIGAAAPNGRNYTDLGRCYSRGSIRSRTATAAQSSRTASRMSVNGQDPRSNVYLIDGTLQNDFTNGPRRPAPLARRSAPNDS